MTSERNVIREGGLSAFKSRYKRAGGMDFTAERNDLYGLTAGMSDWRWRNICFHNIGKFIPLLNCCRHSIALIFFLWNKSQTSRR